MSGTKHARFLIDDAGEDFVTAAVATELSLTATVWAEVGLVIDSEDTAERETIVEKCRGEDINTETPLNLTLSGSVTLKFKRGSALLNNFTSRVLDSLPIGIWNCTGDQDVVGNEGWQFGALLKQLGRPMPDGDYIKYNYTYAPHADAVSPPQYFRVTA